MTSCTFSLSLHTIIVRSEEKARGRTWIGSRSDRQSIVLHPGGAVIIEDGQVTIVQEEPSDAKLDGRTTSDL